ncbi:MAG: bifunctional metallophosphatase/5'-nucleotidase [Bacteroidales bacterium]|nr:bifunctional metallophosphatase/5'-nucleotidase [Bacteroidales bacterium]
MKRNTRLLVFFLAGLCCVWLVSCAPRIPDEAKIVIISFNDVHGIFEHQPALAAFVAETRATYEHVIVVDGGDRFIGNPFNDLYERRGFPIIDIQNHIGVDISVLGNHEMAFGIDVLNARLSDAQSVAISANIKPGTSELTPLKPYHIINKNGINIAFLGLTNVDRRTGIPLVLPERVVGVEFFDPIETAQNFRNLRRRAHVFIALTHIGTPEDIILADAMPELDLIIGGHSHCIMQEPLIQNGVPIIQAGRNARYAHKTKIFLKRGVIEEITTELISMRNWDGPVDTVIQEKIRRYESNPLLTNPFVTLRYEIPSLNQLGNMITDAALTLPNVDFALMNCGGIRIERLYAGAIAYSDILRLSPFGNHLIVVEMTPAEIRQFIETEFMERQVCLAIPGGFEYTVRRMPDNSVRVETITYPDGRKLDENKTYRVALNNYLVSTYLTEFADRSQYTGVSMVDNIVEFLRNNPNKDYRRTHLRARFN